MNTKISITGELGSGKSTIAKILAEEFSIQYLSTGAIQRTIATRYGMTTLELNNYADTHKEIDDEIDNVLRELNTSDKSFVMDSRLAWFFIPTSLKIFFTIDIEVAAKRVLNDSARINEAYTSVNEAIANIQARKKSENERFLKIYNADCANHKNFDLHINTTDLKTVIISQFIADVVAGKTKNNNEVVWCNPKILFPTVIVSDYKSEVIDSGLQIQHNEIIENPVKVIEKNGSWAIVEGHGAVSSAIMSEQLLIPVRVLAKNHESYNNQTAAGYFEANVSNDVVKNWQATHRFTFYK
jgi:CMP/dCMP kinase